MERQSVHHSKIAVFDPHVIPLTDQITTKRTKRQQVEDFLSTRFIFKYNELTGAVEWSVKGATTFRELTDYQLSSFSRQIDQVLGINLDSGQLGKWLESDFTPVYNPLKEYFDSLDSIKSTELSTINELAATVQTSSSELFTIALRRWLVAAVANVYQQDGCQNQTCLVLTGSQGAFKTTWLNTIAPPSLAKYLFCGRIDLQNKDTYALLATKLIINLDDQLRELNKKDAETLKTLISHGNVSVRLPYKMMWSHLPRAASFVASVNGSDFLTDPTGSRRFLPFEVESIDLEKTKLIDINLVWAEACRLYKSDFQYWFTAEEVKTLFGNNESFQVHTTEYELLLEHYEPVEDDSSYTEYLSNGEIQAKLQVYTREPLKQKLLGAALKKSGFRCISKRCGSNVVKKYMLRERIK